MRHDETDNCGSVGGVQVGRESRSSSSGCGSEMSPPSSIIEFPTMQICQETDRHYHPETGPTIRRTKSLMRPSSVLHWPRGHPRAKGAGQGVFQRRLSHDRLCRLSEIDEGHEVDGQLQPQRHRDHHHNFLEDFRQLLRESPIKVLRNGFSRRRGDGSDNADQKTRKSLTCKALRQAVSSLYNLDDFHLEKIGEGFYSQVFKVTAKSDEKVMVLKMNKHRSNRATMLKEVELLNTLSHPNILKYEAACVHDGQLHALTEYISGGSMDQLIQTKGEHLPWSVRVSLALDVAKGVAYLHSRGYFHRDLTSKNILIRKDIDGLSAVVADFGLATRLPRSTSERLPQVGSPYWMSPECLKGLFYDGQADTFSFGIVMCELIARIEADPDVLPRTQNFGVDYIAFTKMVSDDCPPDFLKLALSCVQVAPCSRPNWNEVIPTLNNLKERIVTQEKASDSPRHNRKSGSQPKLLSLKLKVTKDEGCHVTPPSAKHYEAPEGGLLSPCAEVGKAMSLLDPHYVPSPGPGAPNPFSSLPKRLMRSGKIMGNCSCFELPSPKRRKKLRKLSPAIRKSASMINRDHRHNLQGRYSQQDGSHRNHRNSRDLSKDIMRRLKLEDGNEEDAEDAAKSRLSILD